MSCIHHSCAIQSFIYYLTVFNNGFTSKSHSLLSRWSFNHSIFCLIYRNTSLLLYCLAAWLYCLAALLIITVSIKMWHCKYFVDIWICKLIKAKQTSGYDVFKHQMKPRILVTWSLISPVLAALGDPLSHGDVESLSAHMWVVTVRV